MRVQYIRGVDIMNGTSYALIETMLQQAVRKIKHDPERGIRNLVDMALQFSDGRFQKDFFSYAQKILRNESSAYYDLVRDAVSHVDTDKLITFGMNLGYHSCTKGAERIREIEHSEGFDIPWSLILKMNPDSYTLRCEAYHTLIEQGKALGIYTYMLFAAERPEEILSTPTMHSECCFVLFCNADAVTEGFLEKAAALCNLMICIRYGKASGEACRKLRREKLLYSVYVPYAENNTDAVLCRSFLRSVEELNPLFTVFVPEQGCPEMVHRAVYNYVADVRDRQEYRTILWELFGDHLHIDRIISDTPCSAEIDENGFLYPLGSPKTVCNCFEHSLQDMLKEMFPKPSL